MSTKKKVKLEKINNLLQKLANEASKGTPIIVEGQHDRRTLNNLGVKGNFFCLKSTGNILLDQLDKIEGTEAILLVDFDKEGIKLVKKIVNYLHFRGIKVRRFYWRRIKSLMGKDIKDVEGMHSYLERLKSNTA
jgi:5S rRNA maturation endonuclease (ribonuclease M5)